MAKTGKKRKSKGKPPKKDNAKTRRKVQSVDKIDHYLNAKKLVPTKFRGTDKYLDIVSWNIRYFDHQDPERVAAITDIMDTINADIFVLIEIAEDGALDEVAKTLIKRKAGFYSIFYGTTGGQQRVVLMWDRDWVRSKKDPMELFADENLVAKAENGRKADVFPRLPVWGYFEAVSSYHDTPGFNFELVGLHLKSQMPAKGWKGKGHYGAKQRSAAAERLARWLTADAEHYDEDILMFGDWNAPTDRDEWAPFRELKTDGVNFGDINDPNQPTHLVRLNKGGTGGGSRLDLHLINKPGDMAGVKGQKGVVIRWSLFDHLDALDAETRKSLHKAMRLKISDHLPVVSRFYLTDADHA